MSRRLLQKIAQFVVGRMQLVRQHELYKFSSLRARQTRAAIFPLSSRWIPPVQIYIWSLHHQTPPTAIQRAYSLSNWGTHSCATVQPIASKLSQHSRRYIVLLPTPNRSPRMRAKYVSICRIRNLLQRLSCLPPQDFTGGSHQELNCETVSR